MSALRFLCTIAAMAWLWTGCTAAQADKPTRAPPTLPVQASTQASASGEIGAAALVMTADGAPGARIVAATALGGLELYALDGRRLGAVPAGEAVAVDVAYDVPLGGESVTTVLAIDIAPPHGLRFFRLQGDALSEIGVRKVPLGFAAEGVCTYRNPLNGQLNAFVVGDGGEVDQLAIFATADGKLDARQVRRIGVPSPLKQCAVDPVAGHVYASEETVGLWRFNADPEADVSAALVDLPRSGGHIEEEVGGVAVYDGGEGARWLLASNASAGTLNVYDLERDAAYLGSLAVAANDGGSIGEPGPLFAAGVALGAALPAGALLVTDEDAAQVKLVSIGEIASALDRSAGTPRDPRVFRAQPSVVAVTAPVETVPVTSFGDAADDPAIWPHPTQPARSLVVATDKQAGLYVYDMQGQQRDFAADGKMNNVDLRDGFLLDGKPITLVVASDRTRKAIALYRLDGERAKLENIASGPQPTGLDDPYGLCMYRSARTGDTYVFINGDDTRMRQWRLLDAGGGRVRAQHVRDLSFDSQTEGCVADDDAGLLYVGEEDVALWKLQAEPDGGDEKVAVDRVDANPALKDDLEGVGLYDLGGGRGYLVVSSQGNDTYAVYRREGRQEYLGSFAVAADAARGIDGISETDGLEVSSRNLGPGFEHGAMVAQDGRNVLPVQNQNYKYVPWSAIAQALNLEVRSD